MIIYILYILIYLNIQSVSHIFLKGGGGESLHVKVYEVDEHSIEFL